MRYNKIKFNSHIIKFIPNHRQLYIYNQINKFINNKLDINKLHLTLLYLKINKKILKSFINLNKLEIYCEYILKKIKIYPLQYNQVIQPLNDTFAIIYNSSFEFQTAIQKIQNYIIKSITSKLKKCNIKYIFKHKCEKDQGVWLYIDIIKKKSITSIIKMRIDNILPHISFSPYSLYRKKNPISVYDIRKIYRNKYLRQDISDTLLRFNQGYIEFS